MATDESEVIGGIEELVYEVGLTDTAAAIDDNELRTVGVQASLQLGAFIVPANQKFSHNRFSFCTKFVGAKILNFQIYWSKNADFLPKSP